MYIPPHTRRTGTNPIIAICAIPITVFAIGASIANIPNHGFKSVPDATDFKETLGVLTCRVLARRNHNPSARRLHLAGAANKVRDDETHGATFCGRMHWVPSSGSIRPPPPRTPVWI
jgi:hypothetical protein